MKFNCQSCNFLMHDDENEHQIISSDVLWDVVRNNEFIKDEYKENPYKISIAPIWICPNCFHSQFSKDDFEKLKDNEEVKRKFDWGFWTDKIIPAFTKELNKKNGTDYKVEPPEGKK